VFTPPTRVRTASGERRVLLAEGPNEELFEFFEAGPSAMGPSAMD
jgi:hypothetical protein